MPSVIKAGVRPESRKKLIALWKADTVKHSARASKEAAALGARIEAAQTKAREPFFRELSGDRATRAITKELASVQRAVAALAKESRATAQQRRILRQELSKLQGAVDDIQSAHRSALVEAFQRSVKTDAYRSAMLKAMKRPGRIKMKERKFGGIKLEWIPPWLDLMDWTIPTIQQNSFAFEPPYDEQASVSEEFSALVGVSTTTLRADEGRILLGAFSAFAGYQMARGQLGAFLTIPSGFETLKLQARIVDIVADVNAFAIVGGSWASTGTIAEVTDLTSNTTHRVEGAINYVVAPLLFYTSDEFRGPSIFNAELPVSDQGGEILVTAGLKCDVWSALPSGTLAQVDGVVEKVTVELS